MTARRSTTLHALVLAAGASRRFGSPKQLVRFDGQSLLQRAVAHASELLGSAVTVVLGAHAAEIAETLPTGSAGVLINRDWQEGIASSIRIGVQRLPGACDGVMLVLADQPLVGSETLRRLMTAWRRDRRASDISALVLQRSYEPARRCRRANRHSSLLRPRCASGTSRGCGGHRLPRRSVEPI
jgi:CTP:molybdopterin cytidylyltransferase MocA